MYVHELFSVSVRMHGHLRPVLVASSVDRRAVLFLLFGFRVFTFTLQLYSRPVEYAVKGMYV